MSAARAAPHGGWWWLYAAAWLPCFASYLAAFVASGVPLGYAVRGSLTGVLPEATLGVAVLRLPGLLPWPRSAKARFFAAHAGLQASFIALSIAGWALLVGADALVFDGAFRVRLDPRAIPWRVLVGLLIYGALAGLAYALHNAADSREQAALAARAEGLRARAELQALRSQLNPHFILNTLHALLGLVRREPAAAEDALERLGDLLRHTLRIERESADEITLRDEWSLVRSYLDLEQLRLGDRLRVTFDAGPDTLECLVPSFGVQTLVENAVRHAVAPRALGGQVVVRARRQAGHLHVEVRDDGPGTSAAAGRTNGVGLRLLRDRLAALHGEHAGVTLTTVDGGTCALLDVPERA